MKIMVAALMAGALVMTASVSAQLTEGEHGQSYDFGHIGIDYKVYHNFPLINNGPDTIRVDSVHVNCDCSGIQVLDSLLEPGDTIYFRLSFETADLYGPTNRSFVVYTDSEKQPKAQYFYLSIVGQWFNGVVPKPNSLFFLPPHDRKTIQVMNSEFDDLSLVIVEQFDSTFSITPVKTDANAGEHFSLEVVPSKTLSSGTHLSNFTIQIVDGTGAEVSRLTIPVKIVRY